MDQVTSAQSIYIAAGPPSLVLVSFSSLQTITSGLTITGEDGPPGAGPLNLNFPNLTNVGGQIYFTALEQLEEINFLNLEEIGSNLRLGYSHNNDLPKLKLVAMPKVTLIQGFFDMTYCGSSSSSPLVLSFDALGEIRSYFEISYCHTLGQIDFPNLAKVESSLQVFQNNDLHNINLPALESVGASSYAMSIKVENCGSTGAATGDIVLSSLRSIAGRIYVNTVAHFGSFSAPLLSETGIGYNDAVIYFGTVSDMVSVEIGSSGAGWTTRDVDFYRCYALREVDMGLLQQSKDVRITQATTQLERVSLPALHTIFGDLTVEGSDGLPASPLSLDFSTLTTVQGNVLVRALPQLEEMEFPRLEAVGGAVTVGTYNADLLGFLRAVAFPSLTTVGGSLYMYRAGENAGQALEVGLPSLGVVRGHIDIRSVHSLESLALPNLTAVEGMINVDGCTVFHSLSAPLLERTGGLYTSQCYGCGLRVANSGGTAPTTGAVYLPSLQALGGRIIFYASAAVQSIHMPRVEEVGPAYSNDKRVIVIENNAALEEVNLCTAGQEFTTLALFIDNNPRLRELRVETVTAVESLTLTEHSVELQTVSFSRLTSVQTHLSLSGTANGLVVAPLALQFPNLTTVGGNIQCSNFQHLEELSFPALSQVAGFIKVGAALPILESLSLPSLAFVGSYFVLDDTGATSQRPLALSLDALATVRGFLEIEDVANLEVLELPSLTSIESVINIEACPNLYSLSFPVLATTGADSSSRCSGCGVRVINCGSTAGGSGGVFMPSLVSTGGRILMQSSSKLTAVHMPLLAETGPGYSSDRRTVFIGSMPDLEQVFIGSEGQPWATLGVEVASCSALRTARFDMLTAVYSLKVSGVTPELELLAFPGLGSVQTWMSVQGSDGLVSNPLVLDFGNLTTVGDYVVLDDLRNLEALEMPSLERIGGSLSLNDHSSRAMPHLALLSFAALTTIDGSLNFEHAGGTTLQPMACHFPSISRVRGNLLVEDVENLGALVMSNLTSVDGGMQIVSNEKLSSISMPRLVRTGSTTYYNYGVRISSNGGTAAGPGSIAMDSLEVTAGGVDIDNNDDLLSVHMPKLRDTGTSTGGYTITINNNPDLEEVALGSGGAAWVTDKVRFLQCGSLQRLDMDRLAQASYISITGVTSKLRSVSFASLEIVSSGGGTSIAVTGTGGGTQTLLTLDFPSLRTTAGAISISETQNLAYVNMPRLERVGARLYVSGCNVLKSFQVPELAAVGLTGAESITFKTCGSESVDAFSLSFPSLLRVSGDITLDTVDNLVDVAFPNLTAVDGNLKVEDNKRLSSIVVPQVTRVGGGGAEDGIHILRNGATADRQGSVHFERLRDLSGILQFTSNQNILSLTAPMLNETGESRDGHPRHRDTIIISSSDDLETVAIGNRGGAWVTNGILIDGNQALSNVTFKHLQRCLRLRITNNWRIGNLCFPSLLEIGEYSGQSLLLQDNGAMASLCWFLSMRNLAVVGGSVSSVNNMKLVLFDMNGHGPADPDLADPTACFNCPFEPIKMCPSCIQCDADVDVTRLECSAEACSSPTPTYVNDTLRCPRPPVYTPPPLSCATDVSWAELLAHGAFHAGGLGDLMEEAGFESWMCMAHECADAGDLACYKYNEGMQYFEYWAKNSVLGLVAM